MAAQVADAAGLAVHEHVAAARGEVECGDGVGRSRLLAVGRAVQVGEREVAGGVERLLLLRPVDLDDHVHGRARGMRGSEAEIAGMTDASPASRCQSASGSGV